MTNEQIFKVLCMPDVPYTLCFYLKAEMQKLYNIPIDEITYYIVNGTKTPVLRICFEAMFHGDKNSANIFKIRYNVPDNNYEIGYGEERRDFIIKCLRDISVKKLLDIA